LTKFPVFTRVTGNWAPETGSLETVSSSGESGANLISGRNLFDDPGSGPLIILDTPIDLRFVDLSEMLAQEGEHLGI